REDFSSSERKNVRTFFVKSSGTVIGIVTEPYFQYDIDKHPDIQVAVAHLISNGLITDITSANCPMYRIHEPLADWLKQPSHSSKRTRKEPRAA
ncbi:MAG: hypothetical protein KGQ35_00960, partial [Burkholderiales bacterium]|nr:hypothetical protein [Burkholderiales bacterium]